MRRGPAFIYALLAECFIWYCEWCRDYRLFYLRVNPSSQISPRLPIQNKCVFFTPRFLFRFFRSQLLEQHKVPVTGETCIVRPGTGLARTASIGYTTQFALRRLTRVLVPNLPRQLLPLPQLADQRRRQVATEP